MTGIKALGIAAVVLTMCGCAATTIAKADTRTVSAAQSACAQMGLNTSEAPFADCVTSLSRTARAVNTAAEVSGDRGACSQQGLRPGTAAFANCVLDKQEAAAQ